MLRTEGSMVLDANMQTYQLNALAVANGTKLDRFIYPRIRNEHGNEQRTDERRV